jgi:hypothetical protein
LDPGSGIGDPKKKFIPDPDAWVKEAPYSDFRFAALSVKKGKEFASDRQNCDKGVDKLDDSEDDLGLRSVRIEELALSDVLIHKGSKMYHKNKSQPDSKNWEKKTKPKKIQSFSLQYAILIFDIIYNSDVIQ